MAPFRNALAALPALVVASPSFGQDTGTAEEIAVEPEVIVVDGPAESAADGPMGSRTLRELEPLEPGPGISLADRLQTVSGVTARRIADSG